MLTAGQTHVLVLAISTETCLATRGVRDARVPWALRNVDPSLYKEQCGLRQSNGAYLVSTWASKWYPWGVNGQHNDHGDGWLGGIRAGVRIAACVSNQEFLPSSIQIPS